jgi:hypothetical protein
MSEAPIADIAVDAAALREEVKSKYREVGIEIGPGFDTFGVASGEKNTRAFKVLGYPFLARKPG